MIKRIGICVLTLALFISSSMTAFACDEDQTNVYVMQILFGDDAFAYESDEDVEKLLSEGVTSNIEGFISKNGKNFNAKLKLDSENKVVFDFSN